MRWFVDHSLWFTLRDVFLAGDPPLAVQLLILNTLFLILNLLRRFAGDLAVRREVARGLVWVALAANLLLIVNVDARILPFI